MSDNAYGILDGPFTDDIHIHIYIYIYYIYIYICIYIYIYNVYTPIWVNYDDLTVLPHWKSWFLHGNHE